MKKKIIGFMLAVCAIISLTLCAHASEIIDSGKCGAQDDNVTWTLDSEGTLTISGEGEMADYMNDDAPWYTDHQYDIKKAVVNQGVTNISAGAFYECYQMANIDLPDTITSIGGYSFAHSGLTAIEIPNGVTEIGKSAFYYCFNLTEITLPDTVTYIGDNTFEYCDFANINIQSGVTYIGKGAFSSCDNLTEINIPYGITSIEKDTFSGCDSLTEVTIPESVTIIKEDAFYGCENLKSITIPDNVEEIEGWAFAFCNSLKEVTVPKSTIRSNAFSDCSALEKINIGEYVSSISEYAFGKCKSLTDINVSSLNNKYTSVNGVLFDKNKTELIIYPPNKPNTSYNIPQGVKSLNQAFCGSKNLKNVYVPDSVLEFTSTSFSECGSLYITVNEKNRNFSSVDGVLFNKNRTELMSYAKDKICPEYTIPYGTKSIFPSAFADCTELTSVIIPEGITSICDQMFMRCTNLENIEIPKSVSSIERNAFVECNALSDIYYGASEMDWKKISITEHNDILNNTTIHYNSTMPDLHEPCFLISNSSITNTSDKKRRVSVIVAEYADNGGFINAVINTVTFDAGETKSFDTPENTFKIFVWDSLSGMRPMAL